MQVPFKQYLQVCRRMAPWLLLPRILLFLDTLRPRDKDGSEGVAALCSGFLCAILGFVAETATVFLQTLALFCPLVTGTFSSFNASHSLTIFYHCSCFNLPISGVKVSLSKLLIFSPLHYCLQFLIIGHRYLLMNLIVVQFQCSFELRGLTYSQFVQTSQDIIGWNL